MGGIAPGDSSRQLREGDIAARHGVIPDLRLYSSCQVGVSKLGNTP